MSLAEAIKRRFPNASTGPMGGDYIVSDTGSGPQISHWDADAMGRSAPSAEEVAAWREEKPVPSVEDYRAAIQMFIDDVARGRGYDSGLSCVSYADDQNPTYAAEGNAFKGWRSSVWVYVFGELSKVQSGERLQPTIPAFLAELPAMEWPA